MLTTIISDRKFYVMIIPNSFHRFNKETSFALVDKRGFFHGGEGGIRTIERLLTVTRFPIVRILISPQSSTVSCTAVFSLLTLIYRQNDRSVLRNGARNAFQVYFLHKNSISNSIFKAQTRCSAAGLNFLHAFSNVICKYETMSF